MSDGSVEPGFEHGAGFVAGEVTGGLGLGPLETQYEELFAEALADGVITPDERTRLEKAADNLGLDRQRLIRLEQAMVAAYQTRNRIQIVERYEESAPSLAPLRVAADGDAGRALLLKRIEQLEARVKELESELRKAHAAINVEVDLSEIESAAQDASEDPEQIWRRIRRDPKNSDGYRALSRLYAARQDEDRRFCVARVLCALNAASPEERAAVERWQRPGLIAPRASLSPNAWVDLLFHPEQEVLTGQIFSLIAPAVLVGRVTALRRDRKLQQPAPSTKQDSSQATITAVRAVPWAAAILGLTAPPIYLEKEREAAYVIIPGVPPFTAVGKQVLAGRSQAELAFLVGRHLSFYRQEHFVKVLFSGVPDLEDLFLAALTIGNPGLPIAEDLRRRVAPIAQAIQPMLEAPQVDALRGCFMRFVEEGGRTNLQRWSQATEKTACRAGFVLSDELAAALRILEKEEGAEGELGKDLLSFAASERYFKLRRRLGIAIDQL
jgi:hypothetical protein